MDKPWIWYVLTLKTGKDLAVQLQETDEDLSKGYPQTFRCMKPTYTNFEDKGDSYTLRLNTLLNNTNGNLTYIDKDVVFMVITPDSDMAERLGKRWGKQTLLSVTPGDVAAVTEEKKKFELKKGGK